MFYNQNSKVSNENICSICYICLINNNNYSIKLKYSHEFHEKCINSWINQCKIDKNPVTCPLYKREINLI
jgi:hypothetical protein